jgi:hypothetical protein
MDMDMDMKQWGLSEVISDDHLKAALDALKSVKFGTVTLIIQDGRVVQVDKLEKYRLTVDKESKK